MVILFKGLVGYSSMDDSIELPSGPGKEQEKYRKIRVLGQGSMGRAYLVESIEDSKMYVMKRINIGHLSQKEKESALREAQLHSLFNHPNIVQLKQVYQTTGQKICIIMQYAEGGDLEEFIQLQSGKPLNEQTILSMFIQICLGLQQIHAKRIVHRDLKTANIFLTFDKDIKIGDFGISKSLDKTLMAATTMVGTPYYLSPQMVEGKHYSTKADIWALGVILYQLCCFKLPFDANSLPVLALKILKGSFPPIPNYYSKDLKSLILQMLQVDQKKRPTIQLILQKPFIWKLLSKEEQIRQKEKQEQKKQDLKEKEKQKEKRQDQKKVKVVDKVKEDKNKARREKQEKREEVRKQMRDDLKKKRAEKEKEYQSQKIGSSSLVAPQSTIEAKRSPKKDIVKTPKPQPSFNTEIKKEQPPKPWKNRKPGDKKDVTIEMFVPDLKPKPKQEETSGTGSDFKVQIFVSKKPERNSASLATQQIQDEAQFQARKSMPQISIEPSENYHYSQNNIREELDEMQERGSEENSQEQEQDKDFDMEELLQNIKRLEEKTRNLPDPSKSVCLYEESENFESTVTAKSQPKRSPEQLDNLNSLLNSESLQELRLILENRLGDKKFMYAYSVVKQHLDCYNELLDQQKEGDKQTLKEKYIFNKTLLREKLQGLSAMDFEKNIELLFTLIVYEDLQTQKNKQEESKYSRLF